MCVNKREEEPNLKFPDYTSTDTVEDTELISTFLERSKFTDLRWIERLDNHDWIEDVSVTPWYCEEETTNLGYQCVPPQQI